MGAAFVWCGRFPINTYAPLQIATKFHFVSIGLDRTYMGSVERGERNIAALNLVRIAKTLKVEVGALFSAAKTLIVD